jgi:hypothetical protein
MSWLSNRRTGKKPFHNRKEEVSFRIAAKILALQRQLANYLNTRTRGISSRGWLAILVCFVGTFGAYCLYLVFSALSGRF